MACLMRSCVMVYVEMVVCVLFAHVIVSLHSVCVSVFCVCVRVLCDGCQRFYCVRCLLVDVSSLHHVCFCAIVVYMSVFCVIDFIVTGVRLSMYRHCIMPVFV